MNNTKKKDPNFEVTFPLFIDIGYYYITTKTQHYIVRPEIKSIPTTTTRQTNKQR